MKNVIFFLFVFFALQADAQSTLNATGSSAVIGGNTYEWSVGEMTLVNTATVPGLVVTQGILQPMPDVTGIKQITAIGDKVNVYPVPAADIVYIQPRFDVGGTMRYTLLDAAGKEISHYVAQLNNGNEKQTVDMRSLAAGNYILLISFEDATGIRQAVYKVQKRH